MNSGSSFDTGVSFERQRMPYSAAGQWPEQTEFSGQLQTQSQTESTTSQKESQERHAKAKGRRYGPRTCRICLDVEHPKFPTNISSTLGISTASSRPVYQSNDPELGRLLSPCKCKGSSKYVHEGCLDAWRQMNPTVNINFWQCPTCKFNYRLARLQWASKLSSKWAQLALTILVIIVSLFILGFIADPILDLWFDPVGSIADTVSNVVSDLDAMRPPPYEEPTTWPEHFTKGFFSLGLIGAIKSFVAMGPWHWINFRAGGLFGGGGSGRRGGTGRSRMDNFNLLFVLIGAFTFMTAVWKFVKEMSSQVLTNISRSVLDVGGDDDDDDESDEAAPGGAEPEQTNEENREDT